VAHRMTDEAPEDKTIRDLIQDLGQQTTTLFRHEIDLAKAELTQKARKAAQGAGMFGAAAVLGLGAFGALTACLILALAIVMPAALAALIVMVVYAAIAAVLALRARDRMKEATPPTPEQTVETLKEDVEWLKNRKSSETA
jgi:uncharacterized membrane protein YqjE